MRFLKILLFLFLSSEPVWAVPAIVQCLPVTGLTTTGMTTTSISFTGTCLIGNGLTTGSCVNPTVGNTMVIPTLFYSSDASDNFQSWTDNQGATANDDVGIPTSYLGGVLQLYNYSYHIATSSGTFTLVATVGDSHGSASSVTMTACEVSGVVTSSFLDQTGLNIVGASSTSITVTASGVNSQAFEIIFTLLFPLSTASNPVTTGYTTIGAVSTGIWAYKIVTAIETSSSTTTFAANDAAGVLSTYKSISGFPSAGGGTRELRGAGK